MVGWCLVYNILYKIIRGIATEFETGDYTLHFYWWFDHPVTDVADYDGDGRPDLFEGVMQDVEFEIQVSE